MTCYCTAVAGCHLATVAHSLTWLLQDYSSFLDRRAKDCQEGIEDEDWWQERQVEPDMQQCL